jgi:hypothetical protein
VEGEQHTDRHRRQQLAEVAEEQRPRRDRPAEQAEQRRAEHDGPQRGRRRPGDEDGG